MAKGTVKWFDEAKGYGFIIPDEGDKDIFFHRSNLTNMEKSIEEKTIVTFEVREGKKGRDEAYDIEPE